MTRNDEPIDLWIRSSRPYLERSTKIDVTHGRTRVRLYEAAVEVGMGKGETIAEACANALNDIMARQEAAAAEQDECDRIHAEQDARRPRSFPPGSSVAHLVQTRVI